MRRAVFCDRDGVVNCDFGYVGKIADFKLIAGVAEGLERLKSLGYLLVLVTNQSGIARGYYRESDFLEVTGYMQELLSAYNARFDAVYYCPHLPDAAIAKYRSRCSCRKPEPGMFLKAKKDLDIDMKNSCMVGDKASDLQAACRAGVGSLVLVGDHVKEEAEKLDKLDIIICKDLRKFAFELTA